VYFLRKVRYNKESPSDLYFWSVCGTFKNSMPSAESKPAARLDAPRVPISQRLLKGALLFVGCALLLNVLVGSQGLPAIIQVRHQQAGLANDLARVRADNARLRAEIEDLRTNDDAIKQLARELLNYAEPGEKVIVVHQSTPHGSPKTP